MHEALAKRYLAKVKARISEGDCPITAPLSVETLEHLVKHYAARATPPEPSVQMPVAVSCCSAISPCSWQRHHGMDSVCPTCTAASASPAGDRGSVKVDEITEDEIRGRAKDLIRRNGWLEQKAAPQLHSIIELMVALGLDIVKAPPASCGYPGCGCDFDAVCRASLTVGTEPTPTEHRKTFVIPDGHVPIFDVDGRATGETVLSVGTEPKTTPAVTALEEAVDERKRQIDGEGWTPAHDDAHDQGELAEAAACYARGDTMVRFMVPDPEFPFRCVNSGRRIWPWSDEWWKPSDRRRNLIKAAALLIAEIERIDRKGEGPKT